MTRLTLSYLLCAGALAGSAQAGVLSTRDTTRLLIAAEGRMVRYIRQAPLDPARGMSQMLVDTRSPLAGQSGQFRVRFDRIMIEQIERGAKSVERRVMIGTLRAFLDQSLQLEDLSPDAAAEIAALASVVQVADDEIREARRELHRLRSARRRYQLGVVRRGSRPSYSHCGCWNHDYCPHWCDCEYHRRLWKPLPYCPMSSAPAVDQVPTFYQTVDDDGDSIADYQDLLEDARVDRKRAQKRMGILRRLFREQVEETRHEIRMTLPEGLQVPDALPRHFKAVVDIDTVEVELGGHVPALVIHGTLVDMIVRGAP